MSLFNTDPNDIAIDPSKDYLAEFVGEGKKFADNQGLARAKAESDAMIVRQNNELAALRTEVERRAGMADLIKQLEATRTPQPDGGNQPPVQAPVNPNTNPTAIDFKAEIQKAFDQRTLEQRENDNLELVAKVLEERLGPGFAQVAAQKAKEIGVGAKFLNDLAKTQPKAVFKLLDIPEQAPNVRSSVQPLRALPVAGEVRNFAFYEKIRLADPRAYNSIKVHNEMLRNLEALGPEEFYS